MWRVLAAILHLGNVEFTTSDGYDDAAQLVNDADSSR